MSDGSNIEWCDATWQPVIGCTRVSPGCDHCYAISVVHRGMSPQHRGLTKLRPKDASRPGVDWNGTVRLQPEKLAEPLRWKKPRRVFVCSLADLFHDAVPFEYIAAVFGVMAACPQHTFLALTKRPARALEFFAWLAERGDGVHGPRMEPDYVCWLHSEKHTGPFARTAWPLPNVHLGTSVEDQQRADERIPTLLQCPAALHWVSAEPLLGPVTLAKPMHTGAGDHDRIGRKTWSNAMYHLGWVVVGGESGPGARPFNIDWAYQLLEQARGLPTRVFVKQLGSSPQIVSEDIDQDGYVIGTRTDRLLLADRKGGDMSEWPDDICVREVPA
jgi:protein gp37